MGGRVEGWGAWRNTARITNQQEQYMQPTIANRTSRGASWASRYSLASALCVGGVLSFASILSLLSAGSLLSIGSSGSILSIGSAGSILSIGSVGSVLSIGAAGGVLRVGGRRGSTHEAAR